MISGPRPPLTPAKQIAPAPWMAARETARLFDALGDNILFVGGCVRNLLIGAAVKDFDLATPFDPKATLEKLEKAGIRVIPTGLDHGTLTALIGKKQFEVTSLRRDVETTGRHAVVAFTDDWAEDAARRDFTMNTLLADRTGRVFDPLGMGLADLEARRVRFVGDADARIREDYLRILRFFRFHARYGRGAPDADALSSCAAHADQLRLLSRERVTQEFLGILCVDAPVEILALMKAHNILPRFFAPDYDAALMARLAAFQVQAGAIDAVARLFVLAGGNADFIAALDDRLILTTSQKKIIRLLAETNIDGEHSLKVALFQHGRNVAAQAVLLRAAREGEEYPAPLLSLAKDWPIPVFPVGGEDLKKLGFIQGPAMGAALKNARAWWIAQDFKPDHESCLAYIKAISLPGAGTSE